MQFLDILLEAKGDKPKPQRINVSTPTSGQGAPTDYTAEEGPEDDGAEEETAAGSTTDATDEEDSSTDYTAEEVDVDPNEDGEDPASDDGSDDTDGGGDDESTDYTAEGDPSEGDDGDGSGDGTDDGSEAVDAAPEEDPAVKAENENNRALLEDFINLYYIAKNVVNKLTSISNSNILVNKIVGQVTHNMDKIQTYLYDFIVFKFNNNKYSANLFEYNSFLEAFRINVQMLKKISVFAPES